MIAQNTMTRGRRDRPVTRIMISLRTLAASLDANRETVRRWLREAGVQPVALGRGPNGAIRYWWSEIEQWLNSHERAD